MKSSILTAIVVATMLTTLSPITSAIASTRWQNDVTNWAAVGKTQEGEDVHVDAENIYETNGGVEFLYRVTAPDGQYRQTRAITYDCFRAGKPNGRPRHWQVEKNGRTVKIKAESRGAINMLVYVCNAFQKYQREEQASAGTEPSSYNAFSYGMIVSDEIAQEIYSGGCSASKTGASMAYLREGIEAQLTRRAYRDFTRAELRRDADILMAIVAKNCSN